MKFLQRFVFLVAVIVLDASIGSSLFAQTPSESTNQEAIKLAKFASGRNVSQAFASGNGSVLADAGISQDDIFTTARERYDSSGGTPVLGGITKGAAGSNGFNLAEILNTSLFHAAYWFLVLLCTGIGMSVAIMSALEGKNPLRGIAEVVIKVVIGAVAIAGRPFIYAAIITLMSGFSLTLKSGLERGALGPLNTGLTDGTLPTLRSKVIQTEAEAYAAILRFNAGDNHGNSNYAGVVRAVTILHKLGEGINQKTGKTKDFGDISKMAYPDGDKPDTVEKQANNRVICQDWVNHYMTPVLLEAANLPKPANASTPPIRIAITAPEVGGFSTGFIPAMETPRSDEVIKKMDQQGSATDQDSAILLEEYRNALRDEVHEYFRSKIFGPISEKGFEAGETPVGLINSMVESVRAEFDKLSVSNFLRGTCDAAMTGLGFLERLTGFSITVVALLLVEVELFIFALTYPLWMIPATSKAFTAPLRFALSAALWLPGFQFCMLFIDSLTGWVFQRLILGVTTATVAAQGSTLATASVGITSLWVTGIILLVAMICYTIACVKVGLKVPEWIKGLLNGADIAVGTLTAQATTLAEGAIAATEVGSALATGGASMAGSAGRLAGAEAGGALASGGAVVGAELGGGSTTAGHAQEFSSEFTSGTFVEAPMTQSPSSQGANGPSEVSSPITRQIARNSTADAAGTGAMGESTAEISEQTAQGRDAPLSPLSGSFAAGTDQESAPASMASASAPAMPTGRKVIRHAGRFFSSSSSRGSASPGEPGAVEGSQTAGTDGTSRKAQAAQTPARSSASMHDDVKNLYRAPVRTGRKIAMTLAKTLARAATSDSLSDAFKAYERDRHEARSEARAEETERYQNSMAASQRRMSEALESMATNSPRAKRPKIPEESLS